MYTLELSGFASKEDVALFLEWFGESGEQGIVYWYEERMPDGNSPVLENVDRKGRKHKYALNVHEGNIIKAKVRH